MKRIAYIIPGYKQTPAKRNGYGKVAALIAGDKEGPEVMRRARAAKRMIKNSSLTIVKGAKHDIGQKEYLACIKRAIKSL